MQNKNTTTKKPQLTKHETAELDRRGAEFAAGLHEFASQAYSAALNYYSKHYNDPVALAEFNRNAGIEKTEAGLAGHIIAILDHPKTPVALYNEVAAWVADATNIKNSSGDSLLNRWTFDPETVTACVGWACEADDLKEIAEENMATVKANDHANGASAGGAR